MPKITLIIFINLLLIIFCISANAGSIILPFWQDNATPVYTMFIIMNTSTVTSDMVSVWFYVRTGNPRTGAPFIKEISAKNLEIFGTPSYPGNHDLTAGGNMGYALCTETGGMLHAVGIVYDAMAHSGYVITCYKGNDDGSASNGW